MLKETPTLIHSLMIKCPNTGQEIPTGVATGETTDLRHFSNESVKCPACGEVHGWSGKQAYRS